VVGAILTRTALSLIAFACLSIGALASNKEEKTVRKVEIDVYDRMVVEHSPSDPNLDFEWQIGIINRAKDVNLFVTVSDDPGKLYSVECECAVHGILGTHVACDEWSAASYSGEIRGKRMKVTARGGYDDNGQIVQTPIPLKKPWACRIEAIVPRPTDSSLFGASSAASTQTLQETSGSATAAALREQDTQQIPQDVTGEARERKEQEAASELDLDPEVFYRLDAGKLVRLESQELSEVRITKWSGQVRAAVPGGKSPVRFRAGESLELVFRAKIASPPYYDLWKLEAKEGKREWVGTGEYSLPAHYSLYGKGSIRVTTQALTPGEYVLRSGYDYTVFCFGVD
jgi:hypothetical protein